MTREGIFLGQLEAFMEVARLGSLTRAADTLFVTQPALTARLNRLEHALGATLLARNHRGARLTEAGQILLPFARQAIVAIEEAQRAIRHVAGAGPVLAIGATPTLAAYVLPGVVNRILQTHPHVSITLRSAASEDLVELLLRDEIHLAVCRAVHQRDLESLPLYEEELVIVAMPSHHLASATTLGFRDLANEVLVALHRSRSYREVVDSVLREADRAPRAIIDVDNSEVAKQMVHEGVGVALLPRTAVAAELRAGTLVELPIPEMRSLRRSMVLLWRRGTTEPPAMETLVRFLRSRLRRMGVRTVGSGMPSMRDGRKAEAPDADTGAAEESLDGPLSVS